MIERQIEWKKPYTGAWRMTDDYAAHLARHSSAPGVDIACPEGTPVLGAADGIVVRCEWGAAGGRYLLLRHFLRHTGQVFTLYSHLSAVYCVTGEAVLRAQTIALSGNTGRTTGPHLHFAVKVDGQWVDPALYIDFEE